MRVILSKSVNVTFRLFLKMPSKKKRGNGHQLKKREIPLKHMKKFFTLRVIKHWKRLTRGITKSLSVKML